MIITDSTGRVCESCLIHYHQSHLHHPPFVFLCEICWTMTIRYHQVLKAPHQETVRPLVRTMNFLGSAPILRSCPALRRRFAGLFGIFEHMGVSINEGTPKWMVCKGNSYLNGWFLGPPIYGNPHIWNHWWLDSRNARARWIWIYKNQLPSFGRRLLPLGPPPSEKPHRDHWWIEAPQTAPRPQFHRISPWFSCTPERWTVDYHYCPVK